MYCNRCKGETNHQLYGEHRGNWYDPEIDLREVLTYRLWICMGCEWGVLEENYWMPGMDEEYPDISYFPERNRKDLAAKRYGKLNPKLKSIYKEAVICYNRKAYILCAAGLRALLEGICQDKRVKGRNLKAKIDGLKPHLPNNNIIRNVHHFRFMGNDAVHELEPPKAHEIELAIGVMEDLMNFFYELDYKASMLREMRCGNRAKGKVAKPAFDLWLCP